jgi:hypothetical protein
MTLMTPFVAALTKFLQAALWSIFGQQALADHVVDGLEGEVGVDRAAAVADQQREMVDLARLAGLEDEADAGAQALADEVVVQPGDRQEGGDRRLSGSRRGRERMMMLISSSSIMRRAMTVQSSSSDLARPFSPRVDRKRMGSTPTLKPGQVMPRSLLANSSFVMMGHLSSICRQASGWGLRGCPPSRWRSRRR